jgi:hypothetical protein
VTNIRRDRRPTTVTQRRRHALWLVALTASLGLSTACNEVRKTTETAEAGHQRRDDGQGRSDRGGRIAGNASSTATRSSRRPQKATASTIEQGRSEPRVSAHASAAVSELESVCGQVTHFSRVSER